MSRTSSIWLIALLVATGCSDDGIILEFHLAKEPERDLHLEMIIDEKKGVPVRKVGTDASGKDTYAIHFNEDNIAVVDSLGVLNRWHQTMLITPTRRLSMHGDFRIVDTKWALAYKTETLPRGGVHSYSVEDGSKYYMDIEILAKRGK
jgi:hypothetical protein